MYAQDGIRVNCIAPGSIEFPAASGTAARPTTRGFITRCLVRSRSAGLGHPEEIANVALFLASPLAGWVTGQTIAVDGGQLL